jgi:hypothetical protein
MVSSSTTTVGVGKGAAFFLVAAAALLGNVVYRSSRDLFNASPNEAKLLLPTTKARATPSPKYGTVEEAPLLQADSVGQPSLGYD